MYLSSAALHDKLAAKDLFREISFAAPPAGLGPFLPQPPLPSVSLVQEINKEVTKTKCAPSFSRTLHAHLAGWEEKILVRRLLKSEKDVRVMHVSLLRLNFSKERESGSAR